jgi:hypothetical protein
LTKLSFPIPSGMDLSDLGASILAKRVSKFIRWTEGPPERSCNEVEVAKLLRNVRREAFWVCSYAPNKVPDTWRPWSISPGDLPTWLKELDKRVRAHLVSKTGGIPDVAAWNPDRPLETVIFVECKGPKEDVKVDQEDWVAAALEHGLTPENFAVAVRHFV